MYEHKTYSALLQEKLALVAADVDKREGSIIYDATAPNSVESAMLYMALDSILEETFADTASRGYLIRRCADRGIYPYPATPAVGIGNFNIDVPINSRFSCSKYNWFVSERIGFGKFYMTCEVTGNAPNRYTGVLTPLAYIDGLSSAVLSAIAINGEDAEETEPLRLRYLRSFSTQSYGFNKAQYVEVTSALPGVGGVKPYRAWKGGGTVKLVITDSNYGVPTASLINTVQTTMDPTQNSGEGLGLAAIDHEVTVTGVIGASIKISSKLTYAAGWSFEACLPYIQAAIDSYFVELNRTWANYVTLVIRISQIETRLLALDGIVDIAGTLINGTASNLELNGDEIAMRGDFTDG